MTRPMGRRSRSVRHALRHGRAASRSPTSCRGRKSTRSGTNTRSTPGVCAGRRWCGRPRPARPALARVGRRDRLPRAAGGPRRPARPRGTGCRQPSRRGRQVRRCIHPPCLRRRGEGTPGNPVRASQGRRSAAKGRARDFRRFTAAQGRAAAATMAVISQRQRRQRTQHAGGPAIAQSASVYDEAKPVTPAEARALRKMKPPRSLRKLVPISSPPIRPAHPMPRPRR